MAILAVSQTSLLTPSYIPIAHSIFPPYFHTDLPQIFWCYFFVFWLCVLFTTVRRELVEKEDLCTCFESAVPLNLRRHVGVTWVYFWGSGLIPAWEPSILTNIYCISVVPTKNIWIMTLILPRSRTGTIWFYTSTSNKRAARPKLYTESLTRDLKLMYSRLTLVRISINL